MIGNNLEAGIQVQDQDADPIIQGTQHKLPSLGTRLGVFPFG